MTSITGWKKICVAVDFSDESRTALLTASELARSSGAELTIAHVREPPPLTATELLRSPTGEAARAVAEEEATLAGWRVGAEQHAGGTVYTRLLPGRGAADEIVRLARDEGFDLLVLATHGRTGLRRVLLGSVAERVLRHAPCPVLVIRPRWHAEAPAHAAS